MVPRPCVFWDAHSATVIHDALCATACITSLPDSVVIGDIDPSGTRSQTQHMSIQAIHECCD
jgi:alpha-D-ribose 1-methylphosphonate 5-triphosphate diphosphatase